MEKPSEMSQTSHIGFTLAELLIALVILAEIATFTIPKVITVQQDSQNKAKAKEIAATIAAAYQQYALQYGISATTGIKDFTQYMNYVSVDSTTTIDSYYTDGSRACNWASGTCLKMHNGAYIQYWPGDMFNGTNTTHGVPFLIDPDGRLTNGGTTSGPGKSLYFFIYYNGRVTDLGNIENNTSWNNGTNWGPNPAQVPPWFSW